MKIRKSFSNIADELERDIARGRYLPGARLPTHRDLAATLGVAVATVSRAYAEIQRRGLAEARAGGGTLVRAEGRADQPDSRDTLDLTVSELVPYSFAAEIFGRVPRGVPADLVQLRYPPAAGMRPHRDAGAAWLGSVVGLTCSGASILVTCGAQHGIAAVLAALVPPGGTILVEELTYHGALAVARQQGLRLQPISMDNEGLIPDALAEAAMATGARAVYCIPTLQNPTSTVMSPARREALVALAERLDLTIVEDDVFGPLVPDIPCLASLAPDRTVYLSSAAKSLAGGFRIGFVLAPDRWFSRIEAAVAATALAASPLLGETVCRLIMDGVADKIVRWKRRELMARQEIVARALVGQEIHTHPVSQNVWLALPSHWRAERFVSRCQAEGVLVSPAATFAVGQRVPEAVRFSIGPPESRAQLEAALRTIRMILQRESPTPVVV